MHLVYFLHAPPHPPPPPLQKKNKQIKLHNHCFQLLRGITIVRGEIKNKKCHVLRAFSHDVTSVILVSQNLTAAMLVFQTDPAGVVPFTYVYVCLSQ